MVDKGLIGGRSQYIDIVANRGLTSYVKNGEVVTKTVMEMVLVGDETDLALLTSCSPGAIAYTAGFAQMWQKSPAGEWVAFE